MIVLEPRRLDDRVIKLQQKNKQFLIENEVLDLYNLAIYNSLNILFIDEGWDFELDAKYISTKKIIGNVLLNLNHIPEWFSNIEIEGYFSCSGRNLISLKNCPKIIHGSFYCNNNNLTTLDDGPTFVGSDYYCCHNSIKFTEEYVKSVCNVKNDII